MKEEKKGTFHGRTKGTPVNARSDIHNADENAELHGQYSKEYPKWQKRNEGTRNGS